MLDKILAGFSKIWAAIPFSSATWFVLGIILFFVWLFSKAQKDPKSPIDWEDMIIDDATGKTSPYKLGYLVGVILVTWLIAMLGEKITLDILTACLTFLLGGAGWNAWLKSKTTPATNTAVPNAPEVETTTTTTITDPTKP